MHDTLVLVLLNLAISRLVMTTTQCRKTGNDAYLTYTSQR